MKITNIEQHLKKYYKQINKIPHQITNRIQKPNYLKNKYELNEKSLPAKPIQKSFPQSHHKIID
jgi:hypothetical protein